MSLQANLIPDLNNEDIKNLKINTSTLDINDPNTKNNISELLNKNNSNQEGSNYLTLSQPWNKDTNQKLQNNTSIEGFTAMNQNSSDNFQT